MMVGSSVNALLLWLTSLLAVLALTVTGLGDDESQSGSKRSLGGGSYALINSVLGQINMAVDLGPMDQITAKAGPISVYIRVGSKVNCWGFGVGNVDISSEGKEPYDLDGKTMDRKDVNLVGEGLQLRCQVNLCIKTSLPFNNWDCGGSITVISDSGSNTRIQISQMVLANDFSSEMPTESVPVPLTCNEKVNMNGIRFEGRNLKKILGIDITPMVIKRINGDDKGMALGPIRDAVCEALDGAADSINNMVIYNPLSELVNITADPVDPLELERKIPDAAKKHLMNVQDNLLTNMVLPIVPVANSSLVAVEIRGDDPMIDTIMDLVGIGGLVSNISDSSLIAVLWQELLNEPLPTNPASPMDVLGALRFVLGDQVVSEFTNFELQDPAFGSVSLEVSSLGLSFGEQGENGDSDDVYTFPLLGKQTVGVPTIDFGDLRLVGGFSMAADINTRALMDQELKFKLEQTFQIDFSVQELFLDLAVLFAMDETKLKHTQVGPLLGGHIGNCLMALFYETPRVAEFSSKAKSMGLDVSGFTDGMGIMLQDLANAVIPIYAGKLPSALDAYASRFIEGMQIIEPETCPVTDQSDPALKQMYDFSQGLVKKISDMVNPSAVNDIIDSVFKNSSTLEVIGEPTTLVSTDLPAVGGLEAQKVTIGIEKLDISLEHVEDIALLMVPKDAASRQELHNRLLTSSFSLNARFTLDTAKIGSGSGRRILGSGSSGTIAPGDSNTFEFSVGLGSIDLLLDLLATLSRYDLEAMQLGQAMYPDCWVSKLQPYGGVKNLHMLVEGFDANLNCIKCESTLIQAFAAKLADPKARQQLFDMLTSLKDGALGNAVEDFSPSNWNTTISNAAKRCAAETVDDTSGTADIGSLEIDESDAHMLLGGLVGLFGAFSIALFAPAFKRRMSKRQTDQEDDAPARIKKCANSKGSSQQNIDTTGLDNEALVASDAVLVKSVAMGLWNNPLVPKWLQWTMPLLLIVNFICFVIGHIGSVIKINLVGSVLGKPVELPTLEEYSVVTSTQELWKGGAVALAILIAVFSIAWPYIKLLILTVAWFAPTKVLSFHNRGRVLHFIDVVGKWSLIELFVVAFVLVFLNIPVDSPDATILWLPENLYTFSIAVVPQLNMYTFIAALLLSLVLSAAAAQYHQRMDDMLMLRPLKIEAARGDSKALVHLDDRVSITDVVLSKWSKDKKKMAKAALVVGMLLSLALLFLTGAVPVLRVEILGLVGRAMELGGNSAVNEYSLFTFVGYNFGSEIPTGQTFLAFVILVVAFIIPLMQMLLIAALVTPVNKLSAMSLEWALRLRAVNSLLCAFAALEVFLLAIGFSVLELGMLTKSLLSDQCAPVETIIKSWLLPLNIVSLRDAQAGCFALDASLSSAIWGLLTYVLVSNIMHMVISKMIRKYIIARVSGNLGRADSSASIESESKPQSSHSASSDEACYDIEEAAAMAEPVKHLDMESDDRTEAPEHKTSIIALS